MSTSLKNNLMLFFVVIIYLSYSYFVLTPNRFQSFSLIDDGQTILNNSYFRECFNGKGCNNLINVLAEKEFGRFRPAYWSINYFAFEAIGLNPILLHQVRVYIIGLLTILLLGIILFKSGGSAISVLISSLFFFTSFSFTENVVRLGPVEPYQLISVALMSYFYLYGGKSKWPFIVGFYLLSTLIKETSVVLLFPLLITSFYFKEDDKKNVVIMSILGIIFFISTRYFTKPVDSSVAYIENFQFDISLIINNFRQYFQLILNSTSPFIKTFSLIYIFLIISGKNIKLLFNKKVIYWLLIFIFFTGVLIPWKYVLERYVLVSLFSLSIVIGLLITQIQKFIFDYYTRNKIGKLFLLVVNSVFILLLINMVFFKFPIDYAKSVNYRNWYSQFLRFENDQVTAIVNTRADTVYINAVDTIDNWEVLYEIPIHIKHIFIRDVKVVRVDAIPDKGYVFVRTPFLTSFSEAELIDNKFSLIDSGSYRVTQIDPIKFRETFAFRPLSALIKPIILSQEYQYSWKIYFKK